MIDIQRQFSRRNHPPGRVLSGTVSGGNTCSLTAGFKIDAILSFGFAASYGRAVQIQTVDAD